MNTAPSAPPVRLGLAVPFFNEGPLVTGVVTELRRALDATGVEWRLALVDNGSTDETAARIDASASARILPLHLAENAGYGGGILHGLHVLRDRFAPPFIGWAWGDGQVDPSVLPALLADCEAGAALAKVRRVRREDGLQRRVITAGYQRATRALGIRTTDVNGCPKLFRAERLWALSPSSQDWFLDPELVFGLEAEGARIEDHPATMRPRAAGRSKVSWGTVAGFSVALLKWRLGWRPR